MGVQLVVASGSRAGQVIPVTGERFVIGRADDCHLKPRSELISRYHCEIFFDEGDPFVRDMGSKNGVFRNGHQITETNELKNGDKLTIGPLEFFVHIGIGDKPPKQAKVQSVGDAVARTAAIQSKNAQKTQEDSIADWLRPLSGNEGETETRTVDASELMAHLRSQSEGAADVEEDDDPDLYDNPGMRPGASASSRDAASALLQKFFKGGK